MNKEIKYQSIQAGPFTSSQNRINFEIPSDGVYDLSESTINLNVEVQASDDGTGGQGIYPMGIRWAGSEPISVPNVALVKNAALRTSTGGNLENIRRVDQIATVLDHFGTSILQKRSRSKDSLTQTIGINKQQFSVFRDINKLGSVKSKENNVQPISIPLSDMFDFCSQAIEIDTTRSGAITCELELNVDALVAEHYMPVASWVEWKEDTIWDDVSTEGPGNQLKSNIKINNLNQSPLFVGLKVLVSAVGEGGATTPLTDVPAVIDSIVWGTDGFLTIEFEQDWGTIGAGQKYVDIKIEPADPTPASIKVVINFGEIVLKKLAKTSSDFKVIEYSTFSTEQTNGNKQTSYQNQFQVEPDADAVVILFPVEDISALSTNDNIVDYRLRIDNTDATDRNIEPQSPLDFDRINMTMTQMKRTLRNLWPMPAITDNESITGAYLNDLQVATIMNPLNQTVREKLLQVNIEAGGDGVEQISLFKHIPRRYEY